MKKLIGIAGGLALFALSALPALAVDCDLGATGPYSENYCRRHTFKSAIYSKVNTATVVKTQISLANSGGNVADLNTSVTGGGIDTDEASSEIDPVGEDSLGNSVWPTVDTNSTDAEVDQTADDAPDAFAKTSQTGPYSYNEFEMINDKTVVVDIENLATVVSEQNSEANSGGNSMSLNTNTSGKIDTGKATSKVSSNIYVNWSRVKIKQ